MAVITPLPTTNPPGADGRANFREAQGADGVQQKEQAEDESRVADAVDDESLLPRVRGRFAQEVESDQQIAAKPYAFPADE